jgi:hypothetical protein
VAGAVNAERPAADPRNTRRSPPPSTAKRLATGNDVVRGAHGDVGPHQLGPEGRDGGSGHDARSLQGLRREAVPAAVEVARPGFDSSVTPTLLYASDRSVYAAPELWVRLPVTV